MIGFQRGLDPKRAMSIGTTTWENIDSGSVLHVKKFAEITEELWSNQIKGSTFKRDGYRYRTRSAELGISTGNWLYIVNITKTTIKCTTQISMNYTVHSALSQIAQDREFFKTTSHTLYGPLVLFKKHFDIVQRVKI